MRFYRIGLLFTVKNQNNNTAIFCNDFSIKNINWVLVSSFFCTKKRLVCFTFNYIFHKKGISTYDASQNIIKTLL